MPKIDLDAIDQTNRTGYPEPFDKDVQGRWYRRLAPAAGLSDFGASHVVSSPAPGRPSATGTTAKTSSW